MNTNSKVLPSLDSNLSCYSPSTLTFSAPTFYLSSFMILVGGRFPFSKNTDIFYVMVANSVTGESPPPENCPQYTASGRFPPSKLPWRVRVRIGVRQFTGGNFPRGNSPSSSQRKSRISRRNFLCLETELLYGGMHTNLKGLVSFNLLLLFYSQWEKK